MKSIRTALSFLALTATVSALAADVRVGKPVTGARGFRESTAAIMIRSTFASSLINQEIKKNEIEGRDRDHLSNSKTSPKVSRWPSVESLSAGGNIAPPPSRGGAPLFSVGSSWTGPTSADTVYRPPDTCGDVSPSSVIIAINGRIRSYSRSGVLGTLNTTADTFFNSVRGGFGISDPRVIFDRTSGRWILEAINVNTTNNRMCIAVSSGEAITAATVWTFFFFDVNVGTTGNLGLEDYATLGVDNNAVYIGGNRFNPGYVGCDAFVVRKSSILGSGPIVVTPFRTITTSSGSGLFTPQGITNDDPAATVGGFIGVDNITFGSLKIARITDPGGTPILTNNIALGVSTTGNPLDTPVNTGSATGSVDALDDRLFYARNFRNSLTGSQSVWTAHNIGTNASGVGVTTGATRTAGRWYEIANLYSGTPTVVQSGTVFDPAATSPNYFSIPSIAANLQGHALIGGSYGNYANSIGVATADRLSSDTLGTMAGQIVRQAGLGTYALAGGSTNQRWGDYSTSVVDPADGMSIWTMQEFVSAVNQYGVRVIKMLAPAPTASSTVVNVAQGGSAVVNVSGTGLFDPGAGYPNHLTATVSGTGVSVTSVVFNSPTSATVNVSATAGATTGSRNLTITNPDGQSVTIVGAINVTPGSATINGTLTLSSYSGPVSALQFTFELRDNTTNAVLQTNNITGLGAGNSFSLTTTLPANTYKLRVKAAIRFLGAVNSVTLTSGGTVTSNFTLTNGDCNGDNVVGNLDLNQLRASFGTTTGGPGFTAGADLDGNGSVGNVDLNILRASFGQTGQ